MKILEVLPLWLALCGALPGTCLAINTTGLGNNGAAVWFAVKVILCYFSLGSSCESCRKLRVNLPFAVAYASGKLALTVICVVNF